jgi:hypothetical protein
MALYPPDRVFVGPDHPGAMVTVTAGHRSSPRNHEGEDKQYNACPSHIDPLLRLSIPAVQGSRHCSGLSHDGRAALETT